jgi:thioesterase domain-containing protein
MPSRLDSLRRVLAAELPITQHLGITVESGGDHAGVVLRLPLVPNRNHQGSIFAGSLNAVATLAGWAVVWLALQHAAIGAAVVIQDSTIEYLAPVNQDCFAHCGQPDADTLDRFLQTIGRHDRARLGLRVHLLAGSGRVARFAGRYVALRSRR